MLFWLYLTLITRAKHSRVLVFSISVFFFCACFFFFFFFFCGYVKVSLSVLFWLCLALVVSLVGLAVCVIFVMLSPDFQCYFGYV